MSIYNYIHVCCLTFSIKTFVIKHCSLNIMQNTLWLRSKPFLVWVKLCNFGIQYHTNTDSWGLSVSAHSTYYCHIQFIKELLAWNMALCACLSTFNSKMYVCRTVMWYYTCTVCFCSRCLCIQRIHHENMISSCQTKMSYVPRTWMTTIKGL